jgi:cation transport ATPase
LQDSVSGAGQPRPPSIVVHRDLYFLLLALAGLGAGAVFHGRHAERERRGLERRHRRPARALTLWVLAGLQRRKPGVDLIAALALAGTLAVGEYLAGAVSRSCSPAAVPSRRARATAHRELRTLLGRAPRSAVRHEGDDLIAVPLASVRPGDLLLVKPGEVVPVDGMVEGEPAILDEAALTGEPLPVQRAPGEAVRSNGPSSEGR